MPGTLIFDGEGALEICTAGMLAVTLVFVVEQVVGVRTEQAADLQDVFRVRDGGAKLPFG